MHFWFGSHTRTRTRTHVSARDTHIFMKVVAFSDLLCLSFDYCRSLSVMDNVTSGYERWMVTMSPIWLAHPYLRLLHIFKYFGLSRWLTYLMFVMVMIVGDLHDMVLITTDFE